MTVLSPVPGRGALRQAEGAVRLVRAVLGAAVDWVLEHLPDEHRSVLAHAHARDLHLPETEAHWQARRPRIRPYAEHVVAVIDRLSAHGPPAPVTVRKGVRSGCESM